MRIVVLDGYTLNPGDLSWEIIKSIAECQIYDRTSAQQTIERAFDADIVLLNKTILDQQTINALPNLKYIGVLATGYNVVDLETASDRNITVTNIPEYGTESVAQMVFAHILNHCNQVAHHSATVSDGRWNDSADWCYWDNPLIELKGLTIGIIGLGRIGIAVAKIADAFGMTVIAVSRSCPKNLPEYITVVSQHELIVKSDFISIHCPLTEENEQLINSDFLSKMKRSAYLINTARGPLVNERDLAEALNSNLIAGASLDVLSIEPPKPDNPLLNAKNCVITPHNAWATRAARKRLMTIARANIKAFLNDEPINVVNN